MIKTKDDNNDKMLPTRHAFSFTNPKKYKSKSTLYVMQHAISFSRTKYVFLPTKVL